MNCNSFFHSRLFEGKYTSFHANKNTFYTNAIAILFFLLTSLYFFIWRTNICGLRLTHWDIFSLPDKLSFTRNLLLGRRMIEACARCIVTYFRCQVDFFPHRVYIPSRNKKEETKVFLDYEFTRLTQQGIGTFPSNQKVFFRQNEYSDILFTGVSVVLSLPGEPLRFSLTRVYTMTEEQTKHKQYSAVIGIDWADKEHDLALQQLSPEGQRIGEVER